MATTSSTLETTRFSPSVLEPVTLISPSSLNPPSLNSPSVIQTAQLSNAQPPLRFRPEHALPYKRIAAVCLLAAALVLVLMVLAPIGYFVLPGLFVLAALLTALHFYLRGLEKPLVLAVFPGQGLKSPQWQRGIGWSLIEDVTLRRPPNGKARLVLQLRPGMPWPGMTGLFHKTPKDDPVEGRSLVLDLHGLSAHTQQRLYQVVLNHFHAYRSKRGW